jgi:uncharacterized protein YkwD
MVLMFFILVVLNACGSQKRLVYPVSTVNPVPHVSPRLNTKAEYLNVINRMRASGRKCGNTVYKAAKPLRWNDRLYRASYEHSKDMALSKHFSHSGSGTKYDWTAKKQNLGRGSSFSKRIENNGYVKHRGIAENIAYGAKSVDVVMQQWIASPGHCKNIMNPQFTEVGMAEFVSKNGTHYWTQDFAAKLP